MRVCRRLKAKGLCDLRSRRLRQYGYATVRWSLLDVLCYMLYRLFTACRLFRLNTVFRAPELTSRS